MGMVESLEERIKSYISTPYLSPLEFALAGFFFVEEPFTLECYMCDKALEGWDREDPYEEHKLHQKNCPIFSLQNKNSSEATYPEIFTKKEIKRLANNDMFFYKIKK